MITGTIAVLFFILAFTCGGNGEWAQCAILAAIGILALLFGIAGREDLNAYSNRLEYWAMSGKDRAKARHRWEHEAKAEEAEDRRKALEKWQKRNDRKADRAIKKQQAKNRKAESSKKNAEKKPVLKCARCQSEVFELNRITYSNGKTYANCQCPVCGERKLLKVEQ